jgi:hypothetical protein
MDQGHRVVLPRGHGRLVSHYRPDIRENETGVGRQRAGRLVSAGLFLFFTMQICSVVWLVATERAISMKHLLRHLGLAPISQRFG